MASVPDTDILRRAAALMRDDAGAATAGHLTQKRLRMDTASRLVADWLENQAGHFDVTVRALGLHPTQAEDGYPDAFAVARAYLGEAL